MANKSKYCTAGEYRIIANTKTWTNTTNITTSNNVYASVLLDTFKISGGLIAKNFAFDLPYMATVDGFVVSIERYASSSNVIKDKEISIGWYSSSDNNQGLLIFNNLENKSTGAFWTTSEGVVSFGSPTDKFQYTNITGKQVSAAEFGVFIQCECDDPYASPTAYVDSVEMTIYYTLNGIKYSTSSSGGIYYGTNVIKKIYHGTASIYPDYTPLSISWNDVSSSSTPIFSSEEIFSGISIPINILIYSLFDQGITASYILNGVTTSLPNLVHTSITIYDGDELGFKIDATKNNSGMFSIYNLSDGYVLLDSLILTKT